VLLNSTGQNQRGFVAGIFPATPPRFKVPRATEAAGTSRSGRLHHARASGRCFDVPAGLLKQFRDSFRRQLPFDQDLRLNHVGVEPDRYSVN
jgi:hypothetical protein